MDVGFVNWGRLGFVAAEKVTYIFMYVLRILVVDTRPWLIVPHLQAQGDTHVS